MFACLADGTLSPSPQRMAAVTDMNLHQTVKSHAAFALEAHFELVQARWTDSGRLNGSGRPRIGTVL